MSKEYTEIESDPYSLFLFAMNSPSTREKSAPRLNNFFDFIDLKGTMHEKSLVFAKGAIEKPSWATSCVMRFLRMNRDRVERKEITAATLHNSVKVIKLFCEMNDILLPWKRITRGLPKARRYADDRAPTFEINSELIEENKPKELDLGGHRQNYKHKFAPFTKSQRRNRRSEVYKLHFEHGIPAVRIAELMKVDRNTINNDLKFLYNEAVKDFSPEKMSLDDILRKQILRFETQRDRLGLYLADSEDITNKVSIERAIADIDFKVISALDKVNHNRGRFWDEIIRRVNKVAEENNLKLRFTSLFELHKISVDSRKSLNQINEEALKQKKGNSE